VSGEVAPESALEADCDMANDCWRGTRSGSASPCASSESSKERLIRSSSRGCKRGVDEMCSKGARVKRLRDLWKDYKDVEVMG